MHYHTLMKTLGIASLLGKEFIGTDRFRKSLTTILKSVSRTKELIVTQHGKPQAVLLDFQTYLQLTEHSPITIGKSTYTEHRSGDAESTPRGGTLISFRREAADSA